MAKRLTKNYPLGRANVMPPKRAKKPATLQYRDEAYRPNSVPNDRPREPH